jgi:hypothetical protein
MELGRPVRLYQGKYLATGNAGLIRESHKAGHDIDYCHLADWLHDRLLPHDASARWTRAVAILDS